MDSSANHSAYSLAQRRARSVPRVVSPVASLSIRGSVASAVMDTRNLWGAGGLSTDLAGNQVDGSISCPSDNEDEEARGGTQVDERSILALEQPPRRKHQTNDPFLDSINSMLDDIAQPQLTLSDSPGAQFETSFDSRVGESFDDHADFDGRFIDAGISIDSRRDSFDVNGDIGWQDEEGWRMEEEGRPFTGIRMWEHGRRQAELPSDSMSGMDYLEDGSLSFSLPEVDSSMMMTDEQDETSPIYQGEFSEFRHYPNRRVAYPIPLGNQEVAPIDREFNEAMKKHWYRSKP